MKLIARCSVKYYQCLPFLKKTFLKLLVLLIKIYKRYTFLQKVCLNATCFKNFLFQYVEEILGYLKSCFNREPMMATVCVQQVTGKKNKSYFLTQRSFMFQSKLKHCRSSTGDTVFIRGIPVTQLSLCNILIHICL